MTLEEFAVLEAIASGMTIGLSAPIVEKLKQLGLVYGDQAAAVLFLTINGLNLVDAHRDPGEAD
jgi:hypothetical protein